MLRSALRSAGGRAFVSCLKTQSRCGASSADTPVNGLPFGADFDLFNPTPEHRALREVVRNFTLKEVQPQALEFNRAEKLNIPLLRRLGDLGLLGLTADGNHGGSDLDAAAVAIVMEELCRSDPAFCLAYLAHTLLFVNNLNWNGTEAQKAKYLPKTCTGEHIAGMCMSEPGAGTDVLGMKTTAKRDGDFFVLNGSKMWITNGAVNDTDLGDVFLVYAKTDKGLSLFIVEKGYAGFKLGQRIKNKLGMRASTTAELVFDNCRVPAENLVGTEGKAVWCMMRNLEIERLGLAAMGVGIGAECVDVMVKYSEERKAFGQPLNSFGQVQRYIGESYAKYMAGKTYTYNVAAKMRLDAASQRVDTDGVKLYCSTMAKEVADNAIQVLGGNGYVGEYNVERLWRDAKLLEIGGGTLESHHKNMARDMVKAMK